MESIPAGGSTAAIAGTGSGSAGGTGVETLEPGAEGGGAGPGSGGAGEGGAGEGGGETPVEEIGTSADGGEAGEGEQQPEQTDEEVLDSIETDGRKVDAKLRADLAKLAKVDKDAARRIRDEHFRARAIVTETGSENLSQALSKIRNMNVTLEAIGGEEGLNQMQEKVTSYENEIAQFADGDPALVQQLYEDNPEGIVKSTMNALELMYEKNPEHFDQAVLPALVQRLEKAGWYSQMPVLEKLVEEGDGQKAYDLIQQMKTWLSQAKGKVQKHLDSRKEVSPEKEALAKERAEVAREKTQIYENNIATQVNTLNNRATARVVEPFFKEMRLSNEGRRDFINGMNSKIYDLMAKDPTFQRNAKALKAKGDGKRTAEFVAAKFEELLPRVFAQHRNANYPNYKSAPKPAATNGTGANGNGKSAAAPAPKVEPGKMYARNQVDILNTPDIYLVQGQAYLKGTKNLVLYNRDR